MVRVIGASRPNRHASRMRSPGQRFAILNLPYLHAILACALCFPRWVLIFGARHFPLARSSGIAEHSLPNRFRSQHRFFP